MTPLASSPCLLAAVQHRLTSRLVEGFDEWWQMPTAVLAAAGVAVFVGWLYRRDAAEVSPGLAVTLALLRLVALAAVAAALLDVQRVAEHEIEMPSRVAVLVDSSASMALAVRGPAAGTRSDRAIGLLAADGLLESLRRRHEVRIWRFDADAEALATVPRDGAAPAVDGAWRDRLAARGYETRLGEAITRVLAAEPTAVLAGIVVVSDGGGNAGIDPRSAAAAAAAAGVPVHPLGVGSDELPANVRVTDMVAPARVFPGDRFGVTAFLQAQGLSGEQVRVELVEQPAEAPAAGGRVIDSLDVPLAGDGDLVPVRFEVAGLATPGRRTLSVRASPPRADTTPADDAQAADVEVVERVTSVLLVAGGPSREYQFMRNVLQRDASFAVDVLLGTGAAGMSQDARRMLDAFPATEESLAAYDAVVAFDYDWRLLDAAAQARLERWVSTGAGGLVVVAGPVCMDAWLDDSRTSTIRGLYPVELRRPGLAAQGQPAATEPRKLEFTRDGSEAEFLWLAGSRSESEAVWREFPGVFACYPSSGLKPGATVYALAAGGVAGRAETYLAGQFYGAGIVLSVGSGELWRLRAVETGAHERLTTQLVRHVAQGRLLRGAGGARLVVDRDRYPVGGTVTVRLVAGSAAARQAAAGVCQAVAPDGERIPVRLTADASRPDTLGGQFVAGREGTWVIEVDAAAGGERLSRRIQVQLPDRELVRPKLDRGLLGQLATATGGTARFVDDAGFGADAIRDLVDSLPDRSRHDYEAGTADMAFKQRLNAILLGVGCGCLCLEWIIRRLARLA
ncbi:MAG: hypothetical protein ACKOC8_12970 [Pirellulales bacterium]